jgi:hypothetical protein
MPSDLGGLDDLPGEAGDVVDAEWE